MKILVIIDNMQKVTEKFDSATDCIHHILSELGNAETQVICIELKEYGSFAYNEGMSVVTKNDLRSPGFNPVVRDAIRKNKLYKEILLSGQIQPYYEESTEKRHILKKSSAKLCSLFIKENRECGTTYGITIPYEQKETTEQIQSFLTKNGINFKTYMNTWNYEIRISLQNKNFERYVKLSEKCWQKYLSENKPKLERYLELVSEVDTRPLLSAHPNTNTVVNVDSLAQQQVTDMHNNYIVFDVDLYIKRLEILLSVQNNPELVKQKYSQYKSQIMGGMGKLATVASVILSDEYDRLTGKSL